MPKFRDHIYGASNESWRAETFIAGSREKQISSQFHVWSNKMRPLIAATGIAKKLPMVWQFKYGVSVSRHLSFPIHHYLSE